MTAQGAVVPAPPAGLGFADTAAGLSLICEPDCAAAVWPRPALPNVQPWLDALTPEKLPRAREILRPAHVHAAATRIWDAAGATDCSARAELIDDMAALAGIFADLTRAPYLRMRFDVVTTNACRMFHVDAITARLICTYRGTGTQLGVSRDGAEPQGIGTVATGAPIVLRGSLWPEEPRSGLLHRSPPIEGTGETRFVLVLDPVDDPEEAV